MFCPFQTVPANALYTKEVQVVYDVHAKFEHSQPRYKAKINQTATHIKKTPFHVILPELDSVCTNDSSGKILQQVWYK